MSVVEPLLLIESVVESKDSLRRLLRLLVVLEQVLLWMMGVTIAFLREDDNTGELLVLSLWKAESNVFAVFLGRRVGFFLLLIFVLDDLFSK